MTLTGAPLLILLCVLSGAALVATVWLNRRLFRVLSGVGLVALTLLAWAASENDQFGYDRTWAQALGRDSQPDLLPGVHLHLARATTGSALAWPALAAARSDGGRHGALVAVDFPGSESRLDRSGYVYLPAEYFEPAYASTRFPVLELISGSPGAPLNWLRQLDIAQVMDRLVAGRSVGPMVLVIPAPNGHLAQSQECVDAVGGAQDDTYLTQDVRADVLATFRVSAARVNWGLAGYSTGGFCAVNLLTRHTDEYAAAASMDGYFHALQDHYTGDLYRGNQSLRSANSPDWVWAHAPPQQRVSFLLLAGGDDVSATAATVNFHDELESEPPVVRDGDGVTVAIHAHSGHSFTAWRADLSPVLTWASQQLSVSAPAAGSPATPQPGASPPAAVPPSPAPSPDATASG